MNRSVWHYAVWILVGASLPSFAFAHVGTGEAGGFMHGLMHPFSGLDHVCAMLAVGLWAAQTGGRSLLFIPIIFSGTMLLGGVVGMVGVGLPFSEWGIALSVLVLGGLVAASVRLSLWLSGGLLALFALCHGYAHGAEMPESVSALAYALGFMMATLALHITGVGAGIAIQRWADKRAVPLAGVGMVFFGLYLAAS